MRSIIDEIAEAEKQADEIRATAVNQGREQIAAANGAAAKALEELEASEREKTRQALMDAEQQGEQAAQEMKRRMSQEADTLCKNAEAHLTETVDELMNKVRRLA